MNPLETIGEANLESLQALLKESTRIYWEDSDLAASIVGLTAVAAFAMGKRETEYLTLARKATFNIASFCWPGWSMPFEISTSMSEIGQDAARLHFRLCHELDESRAVKARAEWMIGAYLLAQQQFDRAQEVFEVAEMMALKAESGEDAELYLAYQCRTAELSGTAVPYPAMAHETASQIDEVRTALKKLWASQSK